jgi:hypothetical protein
MVSEDWMENARVAQDQVAKLRDIRASFLDTAIEVEMDLRTMLVGYFVDDMKKRYLFEEVYENQDGTLGRLVGQFNKVLNAEREPLVAAGVDIDPLMSALAELVKNRNIFAHQPMDHYYGVDQATNRVVSAEVRIGKRYTADATYFNVETAQKAYERARHCEQLIMEMRLPFGRLRVTDDSATTSGSGSQD